MISTKKFITLTHLMIFKIGKPSYRQRSAIWILYLRCLIYHNRLIHIRPSSLVYEYRTPLSKK